MVDQVAGGFKMATAHRAREDLLLLLLPTLLVFTVVPLFTQKL